MTKGIHHITAIASNAQDTLQFYTKVLGLRLVKKTVNQDDVETYHLFFGDTLGHPGMDLTFFIFLPPVQGRRGNGLVSTISLVVLEISLDFWKKRFEEMQVKHENITERFGYRRILFFDRDDQQLELVGLPETALDTNGGVWTAVISQEFAIRNFHSATLGVTSRAMIDPILTRVFGYEQVSEDTNCSLYILQGSKRAQFLEVLEEPAAAMGFNAAGTVHHIAFRAQNEEDQLMMREEVVKLGLFPTEIINRFYFKSVYFRTPAGILFEIATDGPGFTADEKEELLGKKLALPPFLEHEREMIESQLQPLITE